MTTSFSSYEKNYEGASRSFEPHHINRGIWKENRAFNALVFLYKKVLRLSLDNFDLWRQSNMAVDYDLLSV